MSHLSRGMIILTIAGLAAYVTGLQKKVLDPILGGFQDLEPGVQLAILAGIAVLIALVIGWRARARRAEFRAVQAQMAARP